VREKFALLLLAFCLGAKGLAQTFTQQPISQTVVHHGSVTFSVAVSGPGPFRYQWQCAGTNLPSQNIITTLAGNGGPSYTGDGGPATNAGLSILGGIRVDGIGEVFIADSGNNRVCVVRTNGIIQSIAGVGPNEGNGSYGGDGGAATNANLWSPSDVAVDNEGNVYITEVNNHRVRKLNANGIITTFAGVGGWLVSGDGGPATNASVGGPCAVVLDAFGNLLFADAENGFIRRVDTNGIITTVAGSAGMGFRGDGGPVTNASFNFNYGAGLAFDSAGNLFIADSYNNRVRQVDTQGIITTVAGNGSFGYSGDGGPATNAGMFYPMAVAVDGGGNLFIADSLDNRIREVDTNGIISTIAGCGAPFDGSYSGDGGPATNATLNTPQGVAFDTVGNLYISDAYNCRIRKVAFAGSPSITLSNLSPAYAGQYQVIVTGASGSITSAVATLSVSWPALFSGAVRHADGSVTLSCASAPNSTNLLLATTSLCAQASWQVLSTNIAAASGGWQFTDTSASGYPARFYRIISR